MLDRQILRFIRPVTDNIARVLVRVPLDPDEVTWVGLGFGGFACLFAAYGQMDAALIFLILNRICDGLDGAMARVKPEIDQTWRHFAARGKFLDIICDHIFFAAFPLAVAVGLNTASAYLASALLLFGLLAVGSTSLAYGLMVADTIPIKRQGINLGALAEGTEVFAYMLLITLVPDLFVWVTIPFALFFLISATGRIYQVYRKIA